MIRKYIKRHWDSTFDFFMAVGMGTIFALSTISRSIAIYKEIVKRRRYKREGIIRLK